MSGIPKTRRTPTTLPKRKSIRSWRSVNSPGGPFGWQVASPVKNLEEIPADFSIKSEDLRIKTEAWVFGHLVIFMRELTSPTNKNNVICPSNTGNFPFQDRDERRSGNRMCSKFSQNCPCSIKNTSFFFQKKRKIPKQKLSMFDLGDAGAGDSTQDGQCTSLTRSAAGRPMVNFLAERRGNVWEKCMF
jgi:hypothetical protein